MLRKLLLGLALCAWFSYDGAHCGTSQDIAPGDTELSPEECKPRKEACEKLTDHEALAEHLVELQAVGCCHDGGCGHLPPPLFHGLP